MVKKLALILGGFVIHFFDSDEPYVTVLGIPNFALSIISYKHAYTHTYTHRLTDKYAKGAGVVHPLGESIINPWAQKAAELNVAKPLDPNYWYIIVVCPCLSIVLWNSRIITYSYSNTLMSNLQVTIERINNVFWSSCSPRFFLCLSRIYG